MVVLYHRVFSCKCIVVKKVFIEITAGGPLGSNRGDFVCRKASTPSPAQVQRTRPLPTSKRCYYIQNKVGIIFLLFFEKLSSIISDSLLLPRMGVKHTLSRVILSLCSGIRATLSQKFKKVKKILSHVGGTLIFFVCF